MGDEGLEQVADVKAKTAETDRRAAYLLQSQQQSEGHGPGGPVDRLIVAARLAVEQLRSTIGLNADEGERIGEARDALVMALAVLDVDVDQVARRHQRPLGTHRRPPEGRLN